MLLRLRQFAALALTVTILAGIPYLLTAVVTWPNPDLSWLNVQAHLRGWRLPPGAVTTVLLAALWGVWALYLLALLTETAAWLRRGPVRLRPLGPLQVLAATALGTLTTTSAGAAPALAETVATAPSHTDSAEDNQPPYAEQQTGQTTESAYEQRERTRTLSGFGYDSAHVTDTMRTDLASTIELIAQHGAPETPIVITGHTDTAGDADYNQELSERRSQAMAEYVRNQLGEQAPAIETQGRGEEEPLSDADDTAQRRIEITYTITTPVPEEPEPTSGAEDDPAGAAERSDDQAVLVDVPSPAVTGLAAGAAAAAGAAGGYALGTRRRPAPHSASGHRFPTTASSPPEATIEEPEELSELAETSSHPADDHQPQQTDTPPAIAPRVLAALSQSPGIGLEGPDAQGAARALLATALTQSEHDPGLRLVLCADDARHLLGEQTTALLAERDTPTVALVDSLPAALTTVHTTMVERQHQLDQGGADTLAELRIHNADEAPALPLLILLTRSHPDHEADLSGLLLAATDLDITAVILGRWLLGGTLTIDNGTITDPSPPLATLRAATWPAASSQHIQGLLNDLPHRTPAAPSAPEPLSSTTANHVHEHDEERVPQSAAAAPAEEEHAAPAGSGPSAAPGTPAGPPVGDTASDAPASSPPESGELPLPPEDEHPDEDDAEGTTDGERTADGQDAGESSPHPGTSEEPRAASAPEPAQEEHVQRPIQVHLMSRIRLTVDGARVELPRRAAYELAAYLALHHTDGVRLERAITDMWPDEDPRRTQRRFHDAARTLRQTRAHGQEEAAEEPITREAEVYRLNPSLVAVDLWQLHDALDEAEHTDDLARRHSLLQTVAHLYTGDLAAEADYPWIEPIRTRLRHRVTHALRHHAEAVAAEDPHIATAVLERAIDIDPDDENLHAALIRHHLHHGEAEDARHAFTRYTDRMHQIGARPNAHLRDLIEKADTK